MQPREHGGINARGTKLERFVKVGNTQVVDARLEGRPRRDDSAMPIAIRLDNRHRVRGLNESAHCLGVGADR